MVIETATVYAISALFLSMVIIATYLTIFFFIWYASFWGVKLLFRSIIRILKV